VRTPDNKQQVLFSFKSIDDRIPDDHPIRALRRLVDGILEKMSGDFDKLYAKDGRPSIPPECLLRALLLQVFFSIRSERLLMEQLEYNLMYRWFVGLNMDEAVWNHSTFSKNRDRLLEGEIARKFFDEVLAVAKENDLVSKEHFTVDGTLMEAWASHKSFKPKEEKDSDSNQSGGGGKNPDVNFHGQQRRNDTHESKTDHDARLFRKSKRVGAQLAYMGHALMENRNGLVVDVRVTHADGKAERQAAESMVSAISGKRRITLGGDKNYDADEFITNLRSMCVTPHIAQNDSGNRSSNLDKRTVRHNGYEVSQRKRKLVEQIFGWTKTCGTLRKLKQRGLDRVGWITILNMAAFNLIRLKNLIPA
jgi:transposase